MSDEINSPGQLRQYEENQGWLPRQSETPTIGAGDSYNGATLPAPEDVKPMTMGKYAQMVSFNKGDYFSHDNKVYYKSPEGKISHVTGGPEGDRELKPEEASTLISQKNSGNNSQGTTTSGSDVPGQRPAPTLRKRPEMYSGDVEPGTNPMNPPYAPESEAVRGKGGESLSPEMKERIRARLKGTPFENMDLDSLKLYRGRSPWYLPSGKDGITLENHIYWGKPGFDPENNLEHFNYLVEEAVHAGQYQYRDMTRAGYLWEGLKNGYWENKFEKEAQGIAGTRPKLRPTPNKIEQRDLIE